METRGILEELSEREEALRDKELTKSIRGSQEDVKTGRFCAITQLKSRVRKEGKL